MKLNEVFEPLKDELSPNYSNADSDTGSKQQKLIDDYFAKGRFLYRGMKNTGNVIAGDSKGMTRKSSGGNEYLNILVDYILPEWKPFPRRYESFICTTNIDWAEEFGDIYYVIPVGSPTLGISSHYDFWYSFSNGGFIGDTIDLLNNIFELLSTEPVELSPSVETFKKYANLIDRVDVLPAAHENTKMLFDDIKKYPSVMEYFEHAFSTNGFELSKEIPDSNDEEVWFSGKAIFVLAEFAKEKGWTE